MKSTTGSLNDNQTLKEFYNKAYHTQSASASISSDIFSHYTHERLMQPLEWFEALAVCESAFDSGFDIQQIKDFFLLIFKGYDCHASVGLSDEDYAFYWIKINQVFDKLAASLSEAVTEQALQHYNPRRGYIDRPKVLHLLQKAVECGNENSAILLGYYLWFGLCGEADREKGTKLLESAKDSILKQKAEIYKNYILLYENKQEEAKEILNRLFDEGIDSSMLSQAYEQKAFFLELEGKYEEAFEYYTKVLENSCSGFSAMHLGILHYNRSITDANPHEGLKLLELGFNCGRPEVARSLFYCYFQSGQEWQDNERGIYWIEKGHQYYDAYSTYQLAYLYLYDDGYKNIEKGLPYLDQAIEMGYADALACKGYMYYAGDIIEKEIDKSVELLQKAIEEGSGFAAYRLGVIHEEGLLTNNEPDYQSALACYEKAAGLGYIYGYEMAGRYHLNGYAGETDYNKAFNYYKEGAEAGSSFSKFQLAYCYRNGLGTEENPDENMRYLQMTVDENMPEGLTDFALCYEEGYGVEANGKKALEYMLKAAEQGYVYAIYKVGCYYLYGLEGVPVDYSESFKWMTRAAEAEHPYALLEVGDYYLWDYEGIDETQKAYAYFVKAAEQGYVNEGLGTCLEYGIGVEENEGEAFKYYLKAAEDGYLRGMYNTGRCYYYGYGVKENFNEAFRWFNDAAGHEFIPAVYYKGKMLLAGEGCMQNPEEGITLLTQASENEYAEAQYLLGNCYLVGKGVEPNEDIAMELFESAADNGHERAQKITGKRARE